MVIVLKKQIFGSSDGCNPDCDRWVKRSVDLPFPPFIGLYIFLGETIENITSIVFDVDSGDVDCMVDADQEISFAISAKCEHRSIDKIVDDYLARGWTEM